MKIILTGINGFLGNNFAKYLKSNFIIIPLTVRYTPNQLFYIAGDAVVHLAGKAHDTKKVDDPKEYYEANYELTKQLFDAFLESSATVFVFMSSAKAVSDEVAEVLTEDVEANPQTHYGKSKLLAEQYILSKDFPIGKRVYILRPCMIHGPGNKGNLNLLYQIVVKNLPWPLGAFQNDRSFCSIENVCYVIQQILEREDIPSGVYNLSDDETLSTNELIKIIAYTTRKKTRILSVPKKIIYAVARLGDIIKLPLNTERLDKLTENFVVSNTKIKTILQIEKMPVSAKEGLTKTIKSFN
jgi:nucleoside-diphosphate-sugar epimerase